MPDSEELKLLALIEKSNNKEKAIEIALNLILEELVMQKVS